MDNNEPNSLSRPNDGRRVLAVSTFLVLAVAIVFGRTIGYGFVNLDDPACITDNPHVSNGLSRESIEWAFTHFYFAAWLPVTWISHAIDCQLYGLNAAGHHLTNLLLHGANAVLLFLVLRQMTGRLWPSAFAAAIFAVHPLRVESVAWITERKDVLSAFFFIVTLAAYVRYARRPFSILRYSILLVLFALGLMAKPMLVTLPVVLLLLDYWPLNRFAGDSPDSPVRENGAIPFMDGSVVRIILEKIPLLTVAAVFCGIAIWANREGIGLLEEHFALAWRIQNALISYVGYLGMFFYPVGLAVLYPRPGVDLPLGQVLAASLVLILITATTFAARRKCPYLLVGWLWYLVMLVPVIGFVQIGVQTMADRFTYLPQIGLGIALAWGLADFTSRRPYGRVVSIAAATLALAVLMGSAWRQVSVWRDSETLWKHALACTKGNRMAHNSLGNAYLDVGQLAKAVDQYRAAIAIDPGYAMAHYNLGVALAALGRLDEAIEQYQKTVELRPDDVAAHNNLGNLLLIRGQIEAGTYHCQEALRIDPEFAAAHYNMGDVFCYQGRIDEGIAEYREALRTKPDFVDARYRLALALVRTGRLDEAIAEYRTALKWPSALDAEIHNSLGLALAARGRPGEAAAQYKKALAIKPDFDEAQRNLDAILRRP